MRLEAARRPFRLPPAAPITMTTVPVLIRDSKSEDFETLWLMDQLCFAPGVSYTRQELAGYMRRAGAFTLVSTNGNGTITGFLVAQGGSTGHIITIEVEPASRRDGAGSQLLRAAEQRLHSNGSVAVGLETAVDNLAALSFYKRHGYSVIGTRPRYYPNSVDALVLKKELMPSI